MRVGPVLALRQRLPLLLWLCGDAVAPLEPPLLQIRGVVVVPHLQLGRGPLAGAGGLHWGAHPAPAAAGEAAGPARARGRSFFRCKLSPACTLCSHHHRAQHHEHHEHRP